MEPELIDQCEACDNQGWLCVETDDGTQVQPCGDCNYIDIYGDLEQKCRLYASRQGHKLDDQGFLID